MSKISLSPSPTGSAVYTIASPAGSTDRTLTLPDTTAPILAGSGITLSASAPANTLVTTDAGNVGIGTSSPGNPLTVSGVGGTASIGVFSSTGTNNDAGINLLPSGTGNGVLRSGVNALVFAPNFTERMRIDSSGNLLVGTTTATGVGVSIIADVAGRFIRINRSLTTTATHIQFQTPNGTVGTIQTNGSSTFYNTSSDYRLKHDIQPMTGALARVAALKPVTYKWNVDNSVDDGFIAHELAEVCPSAVSGEKDAVDAEGNPEYQGIDTSFLVATLTAAIQELNAINDAQAQTIESLTARVVALEQA